MGTAAKERLQSSSLIIALAGSKSGAGTTHIGIGLSVYLRNHGYPNLFEEKNDSGMSAGLGGVWSAKRDQYGLMRYRGFLWKPYYGPGVKLREPPFQIRILDYGKNIKLGKNVFVNINNYFMDGATIEIGDNVFIGPSCGFYTANHPLDYTNRNQGLEKALPIKIGDNCWFGANVSVMPGVTIGAGCVIAAGAVVTKDMPANSLIAGVPAKVIKTIEQ